MWRRWFSIIETAWMDPGLIELKIALHACQMPIIACIAAAWTASSGEDLPIAADGMNHEPMEPEQDRQTPKEVWIWSFLAVEQTGVGRLWRVHHMDPIVAPTAAGASDTTV